jgi:hypothetical protein
VTPGAIRKSRRRQPDVEIVLTPVRGAYANGASACGRSCIPGGGEARVEVDQAAPSTANHSQPSHKEPEMGDVIFVVLVIATFAVLALIVKGVERLER